jgi:alkylation response protein AidB-like acyl-CoA dehydrogenase
MVHQNAAAVGAIEGSLDVAALRARAAEILPEIAKGAAERERARELPYAEIRRLAAAGLLTFRIPTHHGGPGSSVRDAIQFIIDTATADSNVAQALRPSFLFVEGLRATGTEEEQSRWFPHYLAGEVFGNAGWEIGGANGAIATRIVRDGDNYKVNGSKYYSTGGLFSDWVSTVALDENDQPVSITLPRDREGLQLIDDFDAIGQRLTASGTTKLDNVTVYPQELRSRAAYHNKRSPVTAFAQLFLGAVEAGIAKNALAEAVGFARRFARPIKHSTATRSTADPYVQHAVGEISARAYAAEAVVLRAADAIDAAWAADLDHDVLTNAAVEVAQAQFIAIESALKASELVFDVGGGSTTARTHNLDRHWRNARTVANHNPRNWKAAVIGAYRLDGVEPPLSGLF